MDKTTQSRNLIKSLLSKHAEIVGSQCTEEMETILRACVFASPKFVTISFFL